MSNKYFKPIEYIKLNEEMVYNGRRIKVTEVEYKDQEKDRKIYREHVKAGNAAVILPITKDNKIIMVQEPRTPINKVILGLPAGIIEEGEEANKAAIRELEEETGYLASDIKFLREYYPSVGYSDEKISIYLATGMKKTKQNLDADEDINVILIPFEEAIEMLDKNEFKTASTTIALLHYLKYEKNKL